MYKKQQYSCRFHGVGLCDEFPLITYPEDYEEGAFDYVLEPGMTLCVEALISRENGEFSIKLEDQLLVIDSGFEIKSFSSFNLNYDSEIAKVTHDSLMQTISSIDLTDVDSIFVSCTALKVIDIIETLESKLSTDIISSNQAIIWDSLRLSNINQKIDGFGNLFKLH